MAKNLNFKQVKKEYKETRKQIGYTLKNGMNLNYSPIFPHGDIELLLENMAKQFNQAQDKGYELDDKFTYNYVLFLCIKYFTRLGEEISEDFEEQIDQMKWLIDTGYFKEIIEEVFPSEQIKKVFDKTIELSSKYLYLANLNNQIQDEIVKIDDKMGIELEKEMEKSNQK